MAWRSILNLELVLSNGFDYDALARVCRMARKLLANIKEADSYMDGIFLYTEEWEIHIPAFQKFLTTNTASLQDQSSVWSVSTRL